MLQQSREKRNLGARVLSALLAFVMVVGVLPAMSLRANAATAISNSITLANGGDYTLSTNLTAKTITVPNGVSATVTVTGNVTLNNQASGGSPITIQDGGTLKLVLNGNLTVNGQNASGQTGGYAGINVQEKGLLVISGNATLTATGGAAADGQSTVGLNASNVGGYGGGGAGAGIGGNGGRGANQSPSSRQGYTGGTGENSGRIIVLSTNVTINATGGNGGNGGNGTSETSEDGGGGGGGYPAPGIGGGGFSGGGMGGWGGNGLANSGKGGVNGNAGEGKTPSYSSGARSAAGGGGYLGASTITHAATGKVYTGARYGGGGASSTSLYSGGDGGKGGNGGTLWLAGGSLKGTAKNGGAKNGTAVSPRVSQVKTGVGGGYGYTEGNATTVAALNIHDIASGNLTASGTNNYYVTGTTTTYGITVASGYNGTIYLDNVTIDRSGTTGASAVTLQGNAKATVELIGTTKLYGGSAGNGTQGQTISGETTSGWGSPLNGGPGGSGGGAGIAVPSGTTLTLTGAGTVYAYGGDAGDGGIAGPRAGGGAGGYPAAGIGGGGGAGAGGGGWFYEANGFGYGGGGGGGGGAVDDQATADVDELAVYNKFVADAAALQPGGTLDIPDFMPIRSNYRFLGWTLGERDGDGELILYQYPSAEAPEEPDPTPDPGETEQPTEPPVEPTEPDGGEETEPPTEPENPTEPDTPEDPDAPQPEAVRSTVTMPATGPASLAAVWEATPEAFVTVVCYDWDETLLGSVTVPKGASAETVQPYLDAFVLSLQSTESKDVDETKAAYWVDDPAKPLTYKRGYSFSCWLPNDSELPTHCGRAMSGDNKPITIPNPADEGNDQSFANLQNNVTVKACYKDNDELYYNPADLVGMQYTIEQSYSRVGATPTYIITVTAKREHKNEETGEVYGVPRMAEPYLKAQFTTNVSVFNFFAMGTSDVASFTIYPTTSVPTVSNTTVDFYQAAVATAAAGKSNSLAVNYTNTGDPNAGFGVLGNIGLINEQLAANETTYLTPPILIGARLTMSSSGFMVDRVSLRTAWEKKNSIDGDGETLKDESQWEGLTQGEMQVAIDTGGSWTP